MGNVPPAKGKLKEIKAIFKLELRTRNFLLLKLTIPRSTMKSKK